MVGYDFPTVILLLDQMSANLACDQLQWLLYPYTHCHPGKIRIGPMLAGYLDILTMNNEQCRV